MCRFNFSKKIACLYLITIVSFLTGCFTMEKAEAWGKKKKEEPVTSTLPPLKRSFVLHEGTASIINNMVIDRKGNVYVAGMSDSNCVIIKLDSNLKNIKEMIKFGSAKGKDTIKDLAIDSNSNIFVTGYTDNYDFPVTRGAYDKILSEKSRLSNYEGFITKFSPDLKMLASTFIGGGGHERSNAIAIDRQDNIYAVGNSEGVDPAYVTPFTPPQKAFDQKPAHDGQGKVFIVKLSNDLTTLEAATLLGGNEERYDSDDEAYDLGIDSKGNVWVTGQSNSYDFPVTKGCVGPTYSGKGDIYVSKFNPELSKLLASTYLGGMNQELATAMVIDKKGDVFVGGWTESPDLPMVSGCFDTKYSHEEEDAFIVKFSNDLKQLKAATYLGGDYDASGYGDDLLSAMALSPNGKTLAVIGRSESENFPVTKKVYKNYTNDTNTPLGGSGQHRNKSKPRESSSSDKDYGDGFLTLLDSNLKTCQYSTFMGGDDLEYMDDILFDGKELLLAGITYSYDFPRITTKKKEPWSRGFAIRFNWKKNQ